MSGGGKDVSPAPGPSGPGRGRPKKVRPRENEAGSVIGIGSEVKRRKKFCTAGGETGESGAKTAGAADESETNVVELQDPDPPVTRSGARSEKHPMTKGKRNAGKGGGSDGEIGSVHELGREEESQEEGKDTALGVVLKVHGMSAQATERAAAFPGETGEEIEGHVHLSACCMKPEVLKQTLVCDGCERSFHVTCLKLALQSASEFDDWICTSCSAAYTDSEGAAGVSKVVREDIERKLFSRERKACGDEDVPNKLRGTVRSTLDDEQSMAGMTTSEEIPQDLKQTNCSSVTGGGHQQRQNYSSYSVLPEKVLLDLNQMNDSAAEGSSGKDLGIDLNESRDPDFEEEVLKVDKSPKSPEIEGVTGDATVLPHVGESRTNSAESNGKRSASETTLFVDKGHVLTAEESSGVSDVVISAAAGNFAAEYPCNVGESCIDGMIHPSIAESTSRTEVKPPGTPEECIITNAARLTLFSAEMTGENEKKLGGTSVAEELTTVADGKQSTPLEESYICTKNGSTDFSPDLTNRNEEKCPGTSVGGELTPVVEIKLFGNPEKREDLSMNTTSVISSPEPSAAKETKQACSVVVATDADRIADESGRLVSVASQEAAGVDGRSNDTLRNAADAERCIPVKDPGQDGEVSTTKHSETSDKPARKNGSKPVEHFQQGFATRPRVIEEQMEVSERELASHNALPSFPEVAASPSTSADVFVTQPEWQQSKKAANKTASSGSHADRASYTSDGPNGSMTGKLRDETLPSGQDDLQLKKIGADTLQQLRDSIKERHGLMLADGWEVEVRRRRTEKHLDKYYISPEKHRFRSRVEVMKYLGLWDGSKCSSLDGLRGKWEAQQLQPKEWSTMVQGVARGNDELQLPLKLGDLTVESLGVIDLRPGYWDELHIWPVGYRCTWHDRATSSFCVSEVADGGSAPIFRVTRKYCPTVVGLADTRGDAVGENNGSSDVVRKDLRTVTEDITAASVDKTASCPHGVRSHNRSGFDVEEDESLKALLGDIGSFSSGVHYGNSNFSRESKNLDETNKIGSEVASEDCDGSESRDVIGEFCVEASSTGEVWRLYAMQFLERCRKVSDAFGSIPKMCPHKTAADVGSLPSEVPDFKDLSEKLGEDRFGLNQTTVRGLIETLPNSQKCSNYKSLKQRGLSWQPARLRIREKARKHKKAPGVQVEEKVVAPESVEVNWKDELDAPVPAGERPPPPPGQSLELRLPAQYVGDVLQIWEFLSRFSNLIGFSHPPALEDLEEGFICGSASVSGCVDQSDSLHTRTEIRPFKKKAESGGKRDVARGVEDLNSAPNSTACEATGSPQTPMKTLLSGRTQVSSSMHGSQQKDASRMEHLWEDEGRLVGSPSNDTNCLMDIEPNHLKGEIFSAEAYPDSSEANLMDETGLLSAASVHVPLVKFLVADLQSKVCGSEELPGESEESKHKRGRKRIRDIVANSNLGREKLIGSLSINELTWPEVTRRYIISLSRISEMGETAEYRREECMKILRCIQGDGGVLCGALDGVAGIEIDAQLLAEAEKEISRTMLASEDTAAPATPPQSNSSKVPVEGARGQDPSGECALWVKLLDPIAKLPTNVGSRIRNRVIDALAANPPAWAVEMLEYSISKKVYKGNASGPTKRAVMEVLQRYRGEEPEPKVKKTKKQRKRVLPSPEVVMQRCRIVLRQVATADTLRVVSKSYKCMTHFYESDGEGLVARPLDFRAIDLRLGAGAYGTSPDSFAADMKQIWKNVASLNENGNVEASAAIQLSELFNNLYNKQVIIFQRGGEQAAVTGSEGPHVKSDGLANEESKKNTTEETPPGSDANKPVKAPWEDDSCQVCAIDDDHDNVLLCDGCDAEYHIYCLNPPLPEVPDGNWFCHSCVAVDTGFLEAPPAPESATETKAPDKQDDQHHLRRRYLEEIAEKDQFRKSDESTQSVLRAIVLKLADTDYWHLTLAERVHLLKWLCDQALETYKVRSHLEKSMEVALDLQQKLRTLLAERRRNADLDEARPDSSKEGIREVSILSVLQSRGAVCKRTDEFDEEIPVQVDIVDGVSVPGPSNVTVGTGTVALSDPTEFVGPEGDLGVESGIGTPSDSSFRQTEHDRKDVVGNQARNDPVSDSMDVDPPKHAHLRDCGQLRERCGVGTRTLTREEKSESDDLKVLDIANVLGAERSWENAASPVRTNPLVVVEPVHLFTSFDEGLESRRKCPDDEPTVSPEVEVETEDNSLERNASNLMDAEIEKIKTKLMLLNSRRDLLGRDDMGRIYWALCGSKTTPWLAVETADANNPYHAEDQTGLAARAEVLPVDRSALFSSVNKLENDYDPGKRDPVCGVRECTDPADAPKKEEGDASNDEVQRLPQDKFSWFLYSSDVVLDQLIEWLSPRSSQEKLLKATLLQWKSLLLLSRGAGAAQAGGLRGDIFARFRSSCYGSRTQSTEALASQDVHKSRKCVMPELKASSLLEWRYGQFSESVVKPSSASGGSKRGRKRKVQHTSKISRCVCLEPLWASRCHCMLCHTTYESEVELQAHTSGGSCRNAGIKGSDQQGDIRSGKKLCHNHKPLPWSTGFKSPQQSFAAILKPPDVSRMPMVVHESLRDRINRIGCIADKGPVFAPGLAVSPAFDPALMMVDLSGTPSSLNAGDLNNAAGVLGTVAVGATSWIVHGEGEDLVNGNQTLVSNSENLPGVPTTEAEGTQNITDNSCGRSSVTVASVPVPERVGQLSLDLKGPTTKDPFVHRQPAVSAPSPGSTLLGADDLPHELNGHPSPYKRYSKNFKVTGKQLTIPESSLLPFGEEDLDMLEQVKVKLLDIEAAVTPDMSENARAYPRRRQAWRFMLKFAKSIYTVVQAIILLEQMICADFLRTSWCYWSSLTVAAKTATLSSLFLRVYALDAAIAYEKSENYAGADISNCERKQGRQEKEKQDKKICPPIKPPRKKKKEEVIVIP